MSNQTREWLIRIVIGTILGLALGFAIGWRFWPVIYTNTTPGALRQDYRADYILMAASAYAVSDDLEQARSRLEHLDPESPAAPVVDLAEQLIEENGSEHDITQLARLAWALGATKPTLSPYLESPP
jgi:hypothetical protein